MSHRPAQILAAAARHVPATLVDPPARMAIEALAVGMPAAVNWLGFECRLHRDDRRVDFGVCIDSRDRGRRTVAAVLADPEARTGLEFLRPLVAEWTDADTRLHRVCPVVWAEWDFAAGGASRPFAFVCVDPGFPGNRPRPVLAADELRGAAADCIRLLCGVAADPPMLDRLVACAGELPADARILHLAPQPAERGGGLRGHTSLRASDVMTWLRAIGWPGDEGAARRALELCRGAWRVGVQFAVSDRVAPYLGFEYYSHSDPRSDPEWSLVLHDLVACGLCDRSKADAALAWFGDETVDLPDTTWFINIQRQFYLKLVVAPTACEAKIYLTLHPRFIPW